MTGGDFHRFPKATDSPLGQPQWPAPMAGISLPFGLCTETVKESSQLPRTIDFSGAFRPVYHRALSLWEDKPASTKETNGSLTPPQFVTWFVLLLHNKIDMALEAQSSQHGGYCWSGDLSGARTYATNLKKTMDYKSHGLCLALRSILCSKCSRISMVDEDGLVPALCLGICNDFDIISLVGGYRE